MIAPREPMRGQFTRRRTIVLREPTNAVVPSRTPTAEDDDILLRASSDVRIDVHDVSERRVLALRVLFALDVIGAGVPGLLLLAASSSAIEWLFAARVPAGPVTTMLGCVWLSMGLLAIAGVFRPVRFSPLLLLQLVYKAIWLGLVAVPALWSGASSPVVVTAVFLAWVLAVAATLPWRTLFASEAPPVGLHPKADTRSRISSRPTAS